MNQMKSAKLKQQLESLPIAVCMQKTCQADYNKLLAYNANALVTIVMMEPKIVSNPITNKLIEAFMNVVDLASSNKAVPVEKQLKIMGDLSEILRSPKAAELVECFIRLLTDKVAGKQIIALQDQFIKCVKASCQKESLVMLTAIMNVAESMMVLLSNPKVTGSTKVYVKTIGKNFARIKKSLSA